LTVDEWADERRFLDSKSSAEPGRWRTSRTPYLRQIMRDMGPYERVQTVIFVKGAQLGGTECINNFLGFAIDLAPAPVLFVSPTLEMAKRNSRQRIAPLIEASPALRDKIQNPRSRDSGNTLFMKEFPGGVLILTGANSAAGLRSMPAKYRLYDEVDAYEGDIDGEGDPISLGEARGRTFVDGKRVEVSTPTKLGRSRIWSDYDQSKKFLFFLPCPHCDEFQPLVFKNLRWPKGEPERAEYFCECCGAGIGEEHKGAMLAKGEWRPGEMIAAGTGEWKPTEGGKPGWHGYHLSSLYSPIGWQSWAEIADMWDRAQGDPAQLKAFVNTVLGLPWRDSAEPPRWRRLYDRREDWPVGTVPAGGLVLTSFTDVQGDRLETSVWAWGEGLECWLIEHTVAMGAPNNPATWAKLAALLKKSYQHEGGHALPIEISMVDSGAFTADVYGFVRTQPADKVYASKGQKHGKNISWLGGEIDDPHNGKRKIGGRKIRNIATSRLKHDFYRALRLDRPTDESDAPYPPGYIHLSKAVDEDGCRQLVSETYEPKGDHWFLRNGERNEWLDCWVGARAAAYWAGVDTASEMDWQARREQFSGPTPEQVKAKPEQHRREPPPQKSGWMGRRQGRWI
jgi:phage terminase large subunit GpA-like protein